MVDYKFCQLELNSGPTVLYNPWEMHMWDLQIYNT